MASPSWEQRNARARAKGYENYYDYRIHNYGRERPSAPRPTGALLSYLRGHRSYIDLRKRIHTGQVEIWSLIPKKRNAKGQITEAEVNLVLKDFSQETYILRGKHLGHGERQKLLGDLSPEFGESQRGYVSPGAYYGSLDDEGQDDFLSHYGIDEEDIDELIDYIDDLWNDLEDFDIDISDPYTEALAA